MNEKTIKNTLDGIEDLWTETKGDPDVVIAILDGTVNIRIDALKKANIKQLDEPINNNVHSFHGTFVSSLIFANHQSNVKGIAPHCRGLLKSIYHENKEGQLSSCSQADIAEGIFSAIDHHADIINISGGEKLNDSDEIIPLLTDALEQCEQKGILVVAATGNDGDENLHVPASYPTVLAVGSMDRNDKPSNFSNWTKSSAKHGILAIGENVTGSIPGAQSDNGALQGTSFSTAIVSGVAALLASLQIKRGKKRIFSQSVRHCLTALAPAEHQKVLIVIEY